MTDKQKAWSKEYRKRSKQVNMIFPKDQMDLYEWAQMQDEGFSLYVKRLIREDRERQLDN